MAEDRMSARYSRPAGNDDAMRPLIISLALLLLAAPRAGADGPGGGVPEAWLGRWVLNLSRSTYASSEAPYKRATYRIERTADGFRVLYDMVHPRGGTTHLEWTGRMDGRDYALQGVDQAITYAYTPSGADAGDVVVKVDGRVAARSRITVSPDGRAMATRTTAAGPDGRPAISTTVYEKQALD
jgi:hypothetical protein